MFHDCKNLTRVVFPAAATLENVTEAQEMFYGCDSLGVLVCNGRAFMKLVDLGAVKVYDGLIIPNDDKCHSYCFSDGVVVAVDCE